MECMSLIDPETFYMNLTSGKTRTINFASANQMPDGTKFANELKKAVHFALLKIGSFEIFLFTTIILHILNVSQHLSFPVSSMMPLLVPALAFRFPRMLWSSRVRLSPRTPPRHRYSRGLTLALTSPASSASPQTPPDSHAPRFVN